MSPQGLKSRQITWRAVAGLDPQLGWLSPAKQDSSKQLCKAPIGQLAKQPCVQMKHPEALGATGVFSSSSHAEQI